MPGLASKHQLKRLDSHPNMKRKIAIAFDTRVHAHPIAFRPEPSVTLATRIRRAIAARFWRSPANQRTVAQDTVRYLTR